MEAFKVSARSTTTLGHRAALLHCTPHIQWQSPGVRVRAIFFMPRDAGCYMPMVHVYVHEVAWTMKESVACAIKRGVSAYTCTPPFIFKRPSERASSSHPTLSQSQHLARRVLLYRMCDSCYQGLLPPIDFLGTHRTAWRLHGIHL